MSKKCEKEFRLFENWINFNGLTLNYSKTHCVLLTKSGTNLNGNCHIDTQNPLILPINAIRYLGVMLEHKLTWKDHTQLVVEKLYVSREILSKSRRHALQLVLKCVCYSLVIPLLLRHILRKYSYQIQKNVQIQQTYTLLLKI